jgi:tryptophan-rich sensory protein
LEGLWLEGLIGSIIGALTKSSVDTWYKTLNRSPLNPPNYLFGIAWSVLYAMIATSGWIIWRSDSFAALKTIKKLYVSQLILNWLWTPLFFSYHLTGVSLICLCSIIILVALLIMKSYKTFYEIFLYIIVMFFKHI